MRITVTTDGNFPSQYAHSLNVAKMSQAFYSIGNEVEIVTSRSLKGMLKSWSMGSMSKHYGISNEISVKFITSLTKDFFLKESGIKGYHDKAANYIQVNNPEIVYARSYKTPYLTIQRGIRTIVETHTTLYHHPDLQKLYTLAENPSFLGIVTIHETIKAEHVKRGVPEKKIIVLEDGVDMDQFEKAFDSKVGLRRELSLDLTRRYVVYCGSLYKEKGIQDIIDAAQRLREDPNIVVMIIGGNKGQIRAWQIYAKEVNATNVVFLGFIPNSLVPKYLMAADVLLMPYPKNIEYSVMDINSTSPLKLFEYMASNNPIVSSKIEVIQKILTDHESALLVAPGDIKGLSEALKTLLEDQEMSGKLAANALKLVKGYTWKSRAEKILKFFNK